MPKTQINLERLSREKFNSSKLEWKVSPRLGPDLPFIEDKKNWYFNKKGTDIVYFQSKELGNTKTKCYACNTPILEKSQQVTEWLNDVGPCAAGDMRTDY